MDTATQLNALLDLAEQFGIEVRQVPLDDGGGGLCELRGRRILFVDVLADTSDQIARVAGALACLPELENKYVVPQLRELLERYCAE